MPKRPRQHVLEDLARARLHRDFSSVGWTVEDLDQDYGEDLLVRIFENGSATPWSFYIQSKSTDRVADLLMNDGRNMAFSITSGHAQHWERFWEPVVLTVYDAKTDLTYWEVIQSYLDSTRELSTESARRTVTVHIPTDNLLDDEGIRRLRDRTKRRFERFEVLKQGAEILIDEIQQKWGVTIEYEPELGILILPNGEFILDEAGGHVMTAFGSFAALLQAMGEKLGIATNEIMDEAIKYFLESNSGYKFVGTEQIHDNADKFIREWKASKDRLHHVKRQQELDEE